ncbi:hypothetical protein PAXRUDRAFT_786942 [Paxillus rubicundulus Ve08.2h10]|uniref:DUF6533 domain-containing protein n=1 Tax=Paxillus rubicundulus Ve08.2h10 TaxID=930991 RepID=A0A0D0D592_9AGAM|nr:hypothetical protein PAXRUDRAFT_786942 [Paxillus rubicundulus Ve08.2h10]
MSIPVSPEVFAEDLKIRKAFVAVGQTFLAYDFFLTIDDEWQYIWLAPWTVVKATFLANRYLNLIAQTIILLEEFNIIGHGEKDQFHLASFMLMIFCVECMHIFVIMRAWAIWGCQQKVAIRLAAGYIVYIGTLIGAGTYYGINIQICEYFTSISLSHLTLSSRKPGRFRLCKPRYASVTRCVSMIPHPSPSK